MKLFPWALALALAPGLAAPTTAQGYDSAGPLAVGWTDVAFIDPALGLLGGRIYYPAIVAGHEATADPVSGPYPLHGFLHGYFVAPDDYDVLFTHVASWGFVVASIGTNIGAGGSALSESNDTHALLHFIDGESATPGTLLEGMVSTQHDWSASGHSMGSAAIQYLIGVEPKIRAIAPINGSYSSFPLPAGNLNAFDGSLCYIGGLQDTSTTIAGSGLPYFSAATNARRAGLAKVDGMHHLSCFDGEAATEGHRMDRKLLTAFLLAEVKGIEDAWFDLAGAGLATDPVDVDLRCPDPPLWALEHPSQPGDIVIGQAGAVGELAILLVSLNPAPIPIATPYGTVGLDPTSFFVLSAGVVDATGLIEGIAPSPLGSTGITLYVQGFGGTSTGGLLTRTAELVLP